MRVAIIDVGSNTARLLVANVTGKGAVVPIAEEVARLRDLEFEHPVAVDFLSGAEFDERVTVDPATLSEDDEVDLEQINGIVRALGLGAGDVDVRVAREDELRPPGREVPAAAGGPRLEENGPALR